MLMVLNGLKPNKSMHMPNAMKNVCLYTVASLPDIQNTTNIKYSERWLKLVDTYQTAAKAAVWWSSMIRQEFFWGASRAKFQPNSYWEILPPSPPPPQKKKKIQRKNASLFFFYGGGCIVFFYCVESLGNVSRIWISFVLFTCAIHKVWIMWHILDPILVNVLTFSC